MHANTFFSIGRCIVAKLYSTSQATSLKRLHSLDILFKIIINTEWCFDFTHSAELLMIKV